MIFYVISACKFFKDFKLHTPYELVTFVVRKICLFMIPKYTWINLAYNWLNFFEDSSMELIFVTFLVKATWFWLGNHQASSETQRLFLKSIIMTLSVRSFGVIWIGIGDPGSLGSWCIGGTWWIRDQSGFISCFDAPWSEWPWIADPGPDNHKGTHFVFQKTSR